MHSDNYTYTHTQKYVLWYTTTCTERVNKCNCSIVCLFIYLFSYFMFFPFFGLSPVSWLRANLPHWHSRYRHIWVLSFRKTQPNRQNSLSKFESQPAQAEKINSDASHGSRCFGPCWRIRHHIILTVWPNCHGVHAVLELEPSQAAFGRRCW